jgi:N-acetyltransferase
MLRVHGLDEDDVQHDKICKEYQEGVTHLGWKNERMVVAFNGMDDRILEVRSDDPLLHRNKVVEVQAIVNKELGFARRQNDDIDNAVSGGGGIAGDINMTCYLYISKKRVVGLMMVKRIQRAYELLQPSNKETSHYNGDDKRNGNDNLSLSISRSLKPSRALLGIHQIWVHKLHRHCGIASKLVSAARDYLIFGMSVPIELIAFSSPTEEGLRFAKRYVGSDRPLIYDIH